MSYLAQQRKSLSVIIQSPECVNRTCDAKNSQVTSSTTSNWLAFFEQISTQTRCVTLERIEGAPRNTKGQEIMPLIQVLEVLIVVGVLLWLVNRFIPMQSSIKSILNGVVVIAVVLWLLNVFGLFHALSNVRVRT
jgi:hypothetical protein